MTDRKQFEAMLEALINEDQETAKEIFHNIVVAKSREIYEELLESDFLEEGENPFAKSSEEGEEEEGAEEGEEEEGEEEEEGGEEEEEGEEEGGDDIGGDATDDMIGDVSDDEEDAGEEEGDVEARVMDLEDALEELKAEFEQLMADEEGEDHMGGDEFGAEPAMGGDEFGAEPAPAMGGEDELERMMEYVNKVALPKHGDNGANAKSIVASKNDMGGTSANIAKSFSTTSGGTKGGLLNPSTDLQDGGNINKPGANAGKTAFKKKEPGHGAEKKGTGEKADNTNSMINGAPKRNK